MCKKIQWATGLGLKLGSEIGVRYISVDAYKQSKNFYEKNTFTTLDKKTKNKYTIPMYLDLTKNSEL